MAASAPILRTDLNSITFAVDEVTPSEERFPTTSLVARVAKLTERSLCVASHALDFPVVEDQGHHALLSAVHLAFSRHLPLALTPDAVWLTIAQGFAQHINNHAETLRPLLVHHEGKVRLIANMLELVRQEDWEAVVDQWAEQIEARITPELYDTLVCDFSTTTPIARTASQVAMMETFKPYFDYFLQCICGIPQITLHGTVEDWRKIRTRVERLAQFQLTWWTERLIPLCDAFVATAEGTPSQTFWQHIYKPADAYGGEQITGWIADLFPYILDVNQAPTVRNPLLDKARHELTAQDGLQATFFPTGLSSAPAKLEIGLAPHKTVDLDFFSGFFGVTQNSQTGCLQPEIGWGVQEKEAFDSILDSLMHNHELAPPSLPVRIGNMDDGWLSLPGELLHMLDRFDGGILYANTRHFWKIRPCLEYTLHDIGKRHPCICFLNLSDDRRVGFVPVSWNAEAASGGADWRNEFWIVLGKLPMALEAMDSHSDSLLLLEDVVVIARSLSQFLERILQADGRYYFDDPNFIPDEPFVLD